MDKSFTSIMRKKSSVRLSIGKRVNSDPDINEDKKKKSGKETKNSGDKSGEHKISIK